MTLKYLSPVWVVRLSNRLIWSGTIYYWIYFNHLLGEQGRIFNVAEKQNPADGHTMNTQPIKYERMYALDRPRSQILL